MPNPVEPRLAALPTLSKSRSAISGSSFSVLRRPPNCVEI